MGEHANSSFDLPPSSPTPHTHNFITGLDREYDVCDDVLSPRPSFVHSFSPPDCELLCLPVSIVYFDVHEDKFKNGVDVEKKTCDIIYDDYVWEYTSE